MFGVALTILVLFRSYAQQKDYLKQRISSISASFVTDDLATLTATESDLGTPEYESLKRRFKDIVEVNPDVEFVYATKLVGDTVYFFGDSEPEGSEDESPPGQSYDEVDVGYKEVHVSGESVVIGPTTDRWGTWFSGASPLIYDGEVIGVVGMDIPASDVYASVATNGLLVLIPTFLVVIALVLGKSRLKQRQKLDEDRLALLSLVSDSVRTPLESIQSTTQELSSKVADQEGEVKELVARLSSGVERVFQSVSDVILATQKAGKKTQFTVERVDVVAEVIDLVEAIKSNMLTKHITIQLGNSWPASHVVDTDAKEFKRALNSIVLFAVNRTPDSGRVTMSYLSENGHWKIVIHDQGPEITTKTTEANARLAVPQLIVQHLGGSLTTNSAQNETLYILSFPLSGTELTR
jgi:hypothetical protein